MIDMYVSAGTAIRANVIAIFSLVLLAAAGNVCAALDTADFAKCGEGGSTCSFTASFNGQTLGTGSYDIGPDGELQLIAGASFTAKDGSYLKVGDISGNADPSLLFSGSAHAGPNGGAFVIAFQLPIDLSGPVYAASSIGYSLTAGSAEAGALIKPLFGAGYKILQGYEVDTDGPLPPFSKGVDAGDAFAITPEPGNTLPRTLQSPTYTRTNSFITSSAYDNMTAVVAFSLSRNSTVGFSGSLTQIPVPEPSIYAVLAVGVGFLGFVARRRVGAI
ncbi:MAG: PEP-CTERM sorting domain-containing protein [Betaproteobacteria bacterium]